MCVPRVKRVEGGDGSETRIPPLSWPATQATEETKWLAVL